MHYYKRLKGILTLKGCDCSPSGTKISRTLLVISSTPASAILETRLHRFDTSLFSVPCRAPRKRENMCLKKTIPCILIALGCVHFSYAKTDTKCGGRLDWNNDVTIPKDDDGNYQRNLQCIFQTTFRDIDPNVLLLKWFSFDIAGEMERCSDYVEIYVR